jgi:hypothetical protein
MSGADDTARPATVRPSWQAAPCPPWCAREHTENDHPEDRYHQSEPSIVAAVAGAGDVVPLPSSLRPVSLAVRAGRYADDELTWLVVEPLEARAPRMVLTREAAAALLRGLQEQLTGLEADD